MTELVPCVTEDSNNCYWDAQLHGNGEGRSFITIDDVTYLCGPGEVLSSDLACVSGGLDSPSESATTTVTEAPSIPSSNEAPDVTLALFAAGVLALAAALSLLRRDRRR